MTLRLLSILIVCSTSLIFGCGSDSGQASLQQKEQELVDKEQQLRTYEQQLNLREQELQRRERLVDSIQKKVDTLGSYNAALVGNWTVTMQCTETTCEDYAVGDTKTEQWNIRYQNNDVIVRASVNNKLVRSYIGLFREKSLELTAHPAPDAETHMNVVLTPHATTRNLMEGSRVINRGGNCKVVFALKAEKQ